MESHHDELDMSVKLTGLMKCVTRTKLTKWKHNIVQIS